MSSHGTQGVPEPLHIWDDDHRLHETYTDRTRQSYRWCYGHRRWEPTGLELRVALGTSATAPTTYQGGQR